MCIYQVSLYVTEVTTISTPQKRTSSVLNIMEIFSLTQLNEIPSTRALCISLEHLLVSHVVIIANIETIQVIYWSTYEQTKD